ncbi:hypothetical protein Afil01_25920 [Actinorhabdospora filicis]|uniref:Secreted protein n=1 Tax=Actinorhabdospora filicis TaxID=1785913 RepID=A0A9W6SIN2_9ACTN|nr:hypothetical protein [Actinorhabdospora filicis]GLZ77785.1 hypothetical protein Afil01_25920 [Actinorhabdospora filicis]
MRRRSLLAAAGAAGAAAFIPSTAWAGGGWIETTVPDPGHKYTVADILAFSARDAHAVGGGQGRAAAWHWDGRAWSAVPTAEDLHLTALAAGARGEVWGAGWRTVPGTRDSTAHVARWDGSAWLGIAVPAPESDANYLSGLDVTSRGVWAAGYFERADAEGRSRSTAFIARFDGRTWTSEEPPAPPEAKETEAEHIVVAPGGDVYASGWARVPSDEPGADSPVPLLWRHSGGRWRPVDLSGLASRFGYVTGLAVYRGHAHVAGHVWMRTPEGASYAKPYLAEVRGPNLRELPLPDRADMITDLAADDAGGIVLMVGTDPFDERTDVVYHLRDGRTTVTETPPSTPETRVGYAQVSLVPGTSTVWISGGARPEGGQSGTGIAAYRKL